MSIETRVQSEVITVPRHVDVRSMRVVIDIRALLGASLGPLGAPLRLPYETLARAVASRTSTRPLSRTTSRGSSVPAPKC